MTEFFQQSGEVLAGAQNFYLFLAILGSIAFIIQFVMTVVGLDHDTGGLEPGAEAATADGAEIAQLNFFSLKGIVSFITFFGWAGFFWGHLGWAGLGLALLLGAVMMTLTAFLLYGMLRLQCSGNLEPEALVGCTGTVYLSIPADRKPDGRVTVRLPNCTREVAALADQELSTGSLVRVESLIGNNCYLVTPLR